MLKKSLKMEKVLKLRGKLEEKLNKNWHKKLNFDLHIFIFLYVPKLAQNLKLLALKFYEFDL